MISKQVHKFLVLLATSFLGCEYLRKSTRVGSAELFRANKTVTACRPVSAEHYRDSRQAFSFVRGRFEAMKLRKRGGLWLLHGFEQNFHGVCFAIETLADVDGFFSVHGMQHTEDLLNHRCIGGRARLALELLCECFPLFE